ncbi:hypothetical protein VNO77_19441 [Canavalia gladiata]|uniref:Uncharacterized protein n=1 Tax=Canavalia gladiata TaxID=3824 RepID=A0AAN9QKG8_CANGL
MMNSVLRESWLLSKLSEIACERDPVLVNLVAPDPCNLSVFDTKGFVSQPLSNCQTVLALNDENAAIFKHSCPPMQLLIAYRIRLGHAPFRVIASCSILE